MECHLLGEPVRIAELLSSPPPSPLTSSPSSGVELDDSHLGAMKRGPIGAVRTRATESDSASVPSFLETKERSARDICPQLNRVAVIAYERSGLMFWFTRKKFVGSYLVFKATRRS